MSLRQILPGGVSVAEGWVNDLQSVLVPPEERLIQKAVPKRQREFTAGRTCARAALASLDVPATAILAGRRGEPMWPAGIIGSITHTDAYCGAAVARTTEFTALGIDAEPHTSLDDSIVPLICTEAERLWCRQDGHPGIHRAKLLFCVKESLFKAAYPVLGMDPGFLNVEIIVDLATRSIRAASAKNESRELPSVLDAMRGAFVLYEGLLLAALWIPARGRRDAV